MATEKKANEQTINAVAEKKEANKKAETMCFIIPRRPGDPESIFVGVNGTPYQVKLGVELELPKPVYNVLKLSMRQELVALEAREKLRNQEITSL